MRELFLGLNSAFRQGTILGFGVTQIWSYTNENKGGESRGGISEQKAGKSEAVSENSSSNFPQPFSLVG